MAGTDHLLSREQVAALLAISVRSVRRYTDTGRLPSVHVGRNIRYRRADVEQLIAREGARSGQEGPADDTWPSAPPVVVTVLASNGQGEPEEAIDAQAETTPWPQRANEGPEVASAFAEVSTQAVEALREQLAAVMGENTVLREELSRQAAEMAKKAEAAGLWQGRALTLEAQLKQLTAGERAGEDAPGVPGVPATGEPAPAAPASSGGLWQRMRAALLGQ